MPGICRVCTPPWVHPVHCRPAHGYPRTAGEDSLAALRRSVTETNISDEPLTVVPEQFPSLLFLSRFTVGQFLIIRADPWAIPYGGGPLRANCAELLYQSHHPFHCWESPSGIQSLTIPSVPGLLAACFSPPGNNCSGPESQETVRNTHSGYSRFLLVLPCFLFYSGRKVHIPDKPLFYTFCSTLGLYPPDLSLSDRNLTVRRVSERCVLVRNSHFKAPCDGVQNCSQRGQKGVPKVRKE